MGTDGPMVRLAKLQEEWLNTPFFETREAWQAWVAEYRPRVETSRADLAGPCGTCGGKGWLGPMLPAKDAQRCSTCNGTGTDPLGKAREADRWLRSPSDVGA